MVVIGYGTQKRSDLTGAVSSVKASELQQTPITSIDQGLVGRSVILKYTPQLRFVFDETVTRGNRVLDIIAQLEGNSPAT